MRMTGTTWTVTHITARDRSPNACGHPSNITSSEPWSLTLPSTTILMPRTSNSLPRRLVSQNGYYRYDIICRVQVYSAYIICEPVQCTCLGILLVAVEDFLYKNGTFYSCYSLNVLPYGICLNFHSLWHLFCTHDSENILHIMLNECLRWQVCLKKYTEFDMRICQSPQCHYPFLDKLITPSSV